MNTNFSLAELMICAASEVWRNNGEVLANGIGPGPRLAASIAKLTHSPELMMTDSEARLIEEPVPLGPKTGPLAGYQAKYSGNADFSRIFDIVWRGQRHVMIGPTQVDQYGQTNLSCVGSYDKPKTAILGVRGLPGNSINHKNSFFMPNHSKRSFVSGEVDMVSGAGYNPKRWNGQPYPEGMELNTIITNLCVMNFGGDNKAIQVVSLHPGVTFDQVQLETGFELLKSPQIHETPAPTKEQLEIIQQLDPHQFRTSIIKGNPAGHAKAS